MSLPCPIVYLNGAYIGAEEARISPFDRGFLFADAVYEVTAVYDGQLVDMEGHLARLVRSLGEIGMEGEALCAEVATMHEALIARNKLVEGSIYLQVSRGAYGERGWAMPSVVRPTVFASATASTLIDTDIARNGVAVITGPDIRWARRDIKTTSLLAQAMALDTAKQAGGESAWFLEGDIVTEAYAANAWIVTADNVLVTRNLSRSILAGITRAAVADQLPSGVKLEERSFTLDEAKSAKEAFNTSATSLVAPVVSIDGVAIGDGVPGPVTRAVQARYYAAMGADVARVAPWTLNQT